MFHIKPELLTWIRKHCVSHSHFPPVSDLCSRPLMCCVFPASGSLYIEVFFARKPMCLLFRGQIILLNTFYPLRKVSYHCPKMDFPHIPLFSTIASHLYIICYRQFIIITYLFVPLCIVSACSCACACVCVCMQSLMWSQ